MIPFDDNWMLYVAFVAYTVLLDLFILMLMYARYAG
jgi:hypothetical protein